jgi:hypothetical protein
MEKNIKVITEQINEILNSYQMDLSEEELDYYRTLITKKGVKLYYEWIEGDYCGYQLEYISAKETRYLEDNKYCVMYRNIATEQLLILGVDRIKDMDKLIILLKKDIQETEEFVQAGYSEADNNVMKNISTIRKG